MPVYLRTTDGRRVLLDTAKAKIDYEGVEYDLTGGALEFFEFQWAVVEGTLGAQEVPARVLVLTDPFTGLRIEAAVEQADADRFALAFGDDPTQTRRTRKLRSLLGIST